MTSNAHNTIAIRLRFGLDSQISLWYTYVCDTVRHNEKIEHVNFFCRTLRPIMPNEVGLWSNRNSEIGLHVTGAALHDDRSLAMSARQLSQFAVAAHIYRYNVYKVYISMWQHDVPDSDREARLFRKTYAK